MDQVELVDFAILPQPDVTDTEVTSWVIAIKRPTGIALLADTTEAFTGFPTFVHVVIV